MKNQAFQSEDVAEVFAGYGKDLHAPLQQLRQLIFQVAKKTDGVGKLQETLKWGQVSYLTPSSKSGTTIRIGEEKTGGYALYVNCRSTLVQDWRERYPSLKYQENRSIIFSADEELPREVLSHCIAMALTYHLRKKRKVLPK